MSAAISGNSGMKFNSIMLWKSEFLTDKSKKKLMWSQFVAIYGWNTVFVCLLILTSGCGFILKQFVWTESQEFKLSNDVANISAEQHGRLQVELAAQFRTNMI